MNETQMLSVLLDLLNSADTIEDLRTQTRHALERSRVADKQAEKEEIQSRLERNPIGKK